MTSNGHPKCTEIARIMTVVTLQYLQERFLSTTLLCTSAAAWKIVTVSQKPGNVRRT